VEGVDDEDLGSFESGGFEEKKINNQKSMNR
jgi:hypothetical protein